MVKKEKHFLLLAMHCDIGDIFLHDILHHTGRVTLEDVAHISARCLRHFLYRVKGFIRHTRKMSLLLPELQQ